MKQKPFHVIRCAGIQFTQDEWSEYLGAVYKGQRERIVTTFGKYQFNDADICNNPEKHDIIAMDGAYGYFVTLKYAECGNGLWSFGIDYNFGTCGGGYGVSWADLQGDEKSWRNGYSSEQECKVAGWRKALTYLDHSQDKNQHQLGKLRLMIQDEIKRLTRPQIVQLELFDF